VSSHTQSYRVLCIETMLLVQGLLREAMGSLNFIWSATECIVCGNEIIEYCGADVRTCFCMQTTEQATMTLTYVIRRKEICKIYVYVFNFRLM
jgi:hypothetical protein